MDRLNTLRRLHEAIRHKRPDLWAGNSWIFYHDNAPSHSSLIVTEFLAKHKTKVIAQSPYSPDLVRCDFFLFPKLKYTENCAGINVCGSTAVIVTARTVIVTANPVQVSHRNSYCDIRNRSRSNS